VLVQLAHDNLSFPAPASALVEPNGLLALGGDLSPQRLLQAYQQGIFPWFGADDPILWWSPNPRAVFYPERLHISRSMRKVLRKSNLRITLNHDFNQVIASCARERADQAGTWISPAMIDAYQQLHRLGHAHSIEVWEQETLVGGLYGVAMGRVFCGESMFQTRANASKIALFVFADYFREHGGKLIDCQVGNAHLFSLGAQPIARAVFLHQLQLHQHASLGTTFWYPQRLHNTWFESPT